MDAVIVVVVIILRFLYILENSVRRVRPIDFFLTGFLLPEQQDLITVATLSASTWHSCRFSKLDECSSIRRCLCVDLLGFPRCMHVQMGRNLLVLGHTASWEWRPQRGQVVQPNQGSGRPRNASVS
jgi:hypothetical protein